MDDTIGASWVRGLMSGSGLWPNILSSRDEEDEV